MTYFCKVDGHNENEEFSLRMNIFVVQDVKDDDEDDDVDDVGGGDGSGDDGVFDDEVCDQGICLALHSVNKKRALSSLGKGSGGGSARVVKKPYCFFEKVFFSESMQNHSRTPKTCFTLGLECICQVYSL